MTFYTRAVRCLSWLDPPPWSKGVYYAPLQDFRMSVPATDFRLAPVEVSTEAIADPPRNNDQTTMKEIQALRKKKNNEPPL